MASTEETLSYHVTLTVTFLEMLAFEVNYQKSQLHPAQWIEFLFPYKFNHTKNQPSIGQSKKYQKRASESCGKSRHHDKRANSAPGDAKCFNSDSIPSTPSLSSHPSSQKAQSSSSRGLRIPSMLDWGSAPRTKMEERPPFCLEWESNFTEPSSTDNRHRCFHNGVGST